MLRCWAASLLLLLVWALFKFDLLPFWRRYAPHTYHKAMITTDRVCNNSTAQGTSGQVRSFCVNATYAAGIIPMLWMVYQRDVGWGAKFQTTS